MFVNGKLYQPSLMFAGTSALEWSTSKVLHSESGYTPKHLTRLEMLARDKHYSILQTFVIYGRIKLYNPGPSLTSLPFGVESHLGRYRNDI